MLSYVRGPGRFRERFFAEAVPFWIAALVFGVFVAFVGVGVSVVVGLTAWVAASAVLRWVRKRPRLKRLYRIALALHIVFWTALGILHSHFEAPGALAAPTGHDWGKPRAFRIGVASSVFSLPERTTLAGWGQRPRRLRTPPFGGFGVLGRLGQTFMGGPDKDGAPRFPLFRTADNVADHDLGAQAVVIVPERENAEEATDAAPVALVSLDLVTIERPLVEAVLKRVAKLGYLPETLTLSATHTHSGPGGYSRQPLSAMAGTDHFDAPVFEAIVEAAASAIETAHAGARPGMLCFGGGPGTVPHEGTPILARNRRGADPDAVDTQVGLLGLAFRPTPEESPASGGAKGPAAVLLNTAVHPTLHRRGTTRFARDLAGDLRDAFARRTDRDPAFRYPATYEPYEVLFVNGAAGDASPRSLPVPRDERGAQLAESLSRALGIETPWNDRPFRTLRVRAVRVTRDFGTPFGVVGVGNREALIKAAEDGVFGGGFGGFVADLLALPVNAVLWSSGITEARVAFRFSGAAGAIGNLELAVTDNTHAFGAIVLETERDARRVRRTILWAPAEATSALGRHWRRTIAPDFFFGYTNGVMAYVTTDAEYLRGGYEARSTLYGPQTGVRVGEALKAAFNATRIP